MLYEASHTPIDGADAPSQAAASAPFAEIMVSISQQEYVQLKWDARYWQRQHQRALSREAELKDQIETLRAQVRDLRQRLFGRKTEKSTAQSEQHRQPEAKRPRGQQRGSVGHGRVDFSHLPMREEECHFSEAERCCPKCGKAAAVFPGTEESEIIEIEVQAYRRVIRRKRYRPSCQCEDLPGIMTAPVPARLIPKGRLGVSVWVEILLSKYLYAQPTNRLLQSWANIGFTPSQGTIIGGLKYLAPLFAPVVEALQARQLTEGLCHADETGWRVFEPMEGKVGYRWYLWVIRSTSAIVYVMAPGRSAAVPLTYFSQLLVQTVVVCDRYAAYKKVARLIDLLLAFCWAHVRRDFLTLARSYPDTETWAMGWVARIGTLYHLNDARLAVRDDPVRFTERDRQLRAHLEQMSADRGAQLADASLRRAAHKVLVSLQNHWEGLTVFVDRPEIAMDNNAENALRPFCVGRRNWLFSDTEAGAKASANLYGLIETAKACGLEPYHYLRRIFTDLPKACTVEDFEALLPMNLTSDPTLPRFTPRR